MKYMSLDQRGHIQAEYVWVDSVGGTRSKTKVCNRRPQLMRRGMVLCCLSALDKPCARGICTRRLQPSASREEGRFETIVLISDNSLTCDLCEIDSLQARQERRRTPRMELRRFLHRPGPR